MRITFVGIGREQLAISLFSAIAKSKGHQVSLAFSASLFNDRYNLQVPLLADFFDDTKEVIGSIRRNRPDVLVCSPLTSTYQWMLGVAQKTKEIYPCTKTVFGGVHVSAVPQRVIQQPAVDFICIGEGDIAFPLILEAIEKKEMARQIFNAWHKNTSGLIVKGEQIGFIQDLDSLPMFDKTIWEEHIKVDDIYFTMASRGCPYHCSYCFNSFYTKLDGCQKTKYVRQRSVEHVMAELRFAKNRYNIKLIEFEDDVFTLNKKWLNELMVSYKKEINIPFQCMSHPAFIDDEVAKSLKAGGCLYVQMGVQSLDEEFKRRDLKRHETNAQVEKAMVAMNKYRLGVKIDHMFSLPQEPIESQEKARQLYVKYPPLRIQTFWLNLFPATEITHQALEQGLISLEEMEAINNGTNFDYYRNSSLIKDLKKVKIYKAYELYFKLIPILPKFILKTISPRLFFKLPFFLSSFAIFAFDVVGGFVRGNPDHFTYARHYFDQMSKIVLRRFKKTAKGPTSNRRDNFSRAQVLALDKSKQQPVTISR